MRIPRRSPASPRTSATACVLRWNPSFTAVAVVAPALDIGANTAIYSIPNAGYLRLLPVRRPEQLVVVGFPFASNGERRLPPEEVGVAARER